jgi:methylenetetrahydrofolate reductase (NADPH)
VHEHEPVAGRRGAGEAKALGIRNILALQGDPPRSEEYRDDDTPAEGGDSNEEFTWAVDLVRYIRRVHGDYFCIGVAAYPEGHADESYPQNQDPANDIPYLVERRRPGRTLL